MSKKKIRSIAYAMSKEQQTPTMSLLAHGKSVHQKFNEIIQLLEYG